MTLPRWLSMSPCDLICVGTSTYPINQDQGGLTGTEGYDVNGGRLGRRCQLAAVPLFSQVKDLWEQELFFSTIYIFYSTKLVLYFS